MSEAVGITLLVTFWLVLMGVFLIIFSPRDKQPDCCGAKLVYQGPDDLLAECKRREVDPAGMMMNTMMMGSLYKCPNCGKYWEAPRHY